MSHLLQRATLQLLRAYKWAISPMFPPACRFVPTCSEYAMEAVERYGALRGVLMAGVRLLRCHPFAHGGYDPVVKQDLGAAELRAAGSGAAGLGAAGKSAPWWRALLLGAPRKSGPFRPALSGAEGAASDEQNSAGFSPSGRS